MDLTTKTIDGLMAEYNHGAFNGGIRQIMLDVKDELIRRANTGDLEAQQILDGTHPKQQKSKSPSSSG